MISRRGFLKAGLTVAASTALPAIQGESVAGLFDWINDDLTASPVADDWLAVSSPNGEAFFVSANGRDDGDGSPGRPFATLARALKAADQNSAIILLPGYLQA